MVAKALPLHPNNFERMCREWTDIIRMKESGTWIWPVFNGPYRRVWQFLDDTALLEKLLGKDFQKYLFAYADFKQAEQISKEEVHGLLLEGLYSRYPDYTNTQMSLFQRVDSLINDEGKEVVFFVTGVDALVRRKDWAVLQELKYLAQRGWNTHIILILETDITSSEYSLDYIKLTTLSKNIFITSFYSSEDVSYFVDYMADKWEIVLSDQQRKWIGDNCGGNYWLVKEVLRQIAKNPVLKYEEIGELESLRLKGQLLTREISDEQRDVLVSVVNASPIVDRLSHAQEFLLKQGWIRVVNGKFILSIPYLREFLVTYSRTTEISAAALTPQQATILRYFINHPGVIVTRERLAQEVWGGAWEESFSDWALDQIVHRLRTKLKEEGATYEIRAKKKQGFVLMMK